MNAVLKSLHVGVLIGILSSVTSAEGQNIRSSNSEVLRIRGIEINDQRTPDYDVDRVNMGSSKVREWQQILVEFDTAPDWIDQMDFTFYALVESETSNTGYLMFRGSIDYVNIERGRHQSVMYLHPSTVERFGDVERVAVVVRMNGQLIGISGEPESRQRWWEQLSPVDGYLLNRMQTPFAMINYDNYPAIKPTSRN